jgi:hypothetical protein
VNSEIVSPADAGSGSAGFISGEAPPAATSARRSRWPWLIAALVACAAFAAGGAVEHAADQANASRDLYRAQVLTTISRFLDEERQVIAVPTAQRNASVFSDLADSITADPGVNESGMLMVSAGAGSAVQQGQVIFTVTVASPHGTTAFAVWYLTPQGPSSSDAGACVLWSTLLGSGRATGNLNLGGSSFVAPCPSQYWASGSTDPAQPHFGLAGIHRSVP